jgi:hypothetical protein
MFFFRWSVFWNWLGKFFKVPSSILCCEQSKGVYSRAQLCPVRCIGAQQSMWRAPERPARGSCLIENSASRGARAAARRKQRQRPTITAESKLSVCSETESLHWNAFGGESDDKTNRRLFDNAGGCTFIHRIIGFEHRAREFPSPRLFELPTPSAIILRCPGTGVEGARVRSSTASRRGWMRAREGRSESSGVD